MQSISKMTLPVGCSGSVVMIVYQQWFRKKKSLGSQDLSMQEMNKGFPHQQKGLLWPKLQVTLSQGEEGNASQHINQYCI